RLKARARRLRRRGFGRLTGARSGPATGGAVAARGLAAAIAFTAARGTLTATATAAAPAAGPAFASLTRDARLFGGSAGLLGSAGRFLRLRGDVVGELTDELGHLGRAGRDLPRGGLRCCLATQC